MCAAGAGGGNRLERAATMRKDDAALGKALVKGFASGAAAGGCPPLEEIARMVDGSLADAERDVLLGHLALCDDCRGTYLAAAELAGPETADAQQASGRRRNYLFPSAFAAAAVLVIAVTLQFGSSPSEKRVVAGNAVPAVPRPAPPAAVKPQASPGRAVVAKSKEKPAGQEKVRLAAQRFAPGTEGLAALLTRSGDARKLAPLVGVQEKKLGFAAKGDPSSVAFRVGVNLMDLQIALLADDGDRAQAQATRLGPLLESLAGAPEAAGVERLAAKLEQGDSPAALTGSGGELERLVPKGQVPYARLGAWAEGARLAAITGNRAFLSAGVPRYFGDRVADAAVPPAAAAALRGLEQKLKRKSIDLESVEQDVALLLASF